MATYHLGFFVYWESNKMKTKDSPQFSGTITDTIVSCGLELTLSRGYLRDLPFIHVLLLEMQFLNIICSKEKDKWKEKEKWRLLLSIFIHSTDFKVFKDF